MAAVISRDPSRPASPAPSQPAPSIFSIASTTATNPLRYVSHPGPQSSSRGSAPIVITAADLAHSHSSYSALLSSAKSYRLALAALSTASSTFGSALEACARLKEARAELQSPPGLGLATASGAGTLSSGACTADTLLSASGVHHLIANHGQILSETVYRSFEVPLLHDLDKWRSVMDDEEETYQQRIRAQSKEVKRLEREGLKIHKQKRRDVARFRAHLVELTGQLDGLTALHAEHAASLLRESQETSGRIVEASCSLVRAEVDIFESLARKGWSGGGLDDLLEKGQDLFATEDEGDAAKRGTSGGVAGGDVKLFSILPPKSILADPTPGPPDSLLENADTPTADGPAERKGDGSSADGESVTSTATDNRLPHRGPRPFSPQPIRRPPTDVTFDTSGLPIDDDTVPGMSPSPRGSRDRDRDRDRNDEALERESLATNDSAHWEPLDGGEEVFHLRRRRTTQDSNLKGGVILGDDSKPRVLGVEPSPESTWGSPVKDRLMDG